MCYQGLASHTELKPSKAICLRCCEEVRGKPLEAESRAHLERIWDELDALPDCPVYPFEVGGNVSWGIPLCCPRLDEHVQAAGGDAELTARLAVAALREQFYQQVLPEKWQKLYAMARSGTDAG